VIPCLLTSALHAIVALSQCLVDALLVSGTSMPQCEGEQLGMDVTPLEVVQEQRMKKECVENIFNLKTKTPLPVRRKMTSKRGLGKGLVVNACKVCR
jgi:hypothetical protein